MKKLIFGLLSIVLLTASCGNDDDTTAAIVPDAGVLSGGPFNFVAGDGIVDNVSGITTDPNAIGTNRTFVITDDAGVILGLPPNNEALEGVDFDVAGTGTCLIWYLRFEDGLIGAEMGLNANDLEGSFDLSNSISVVRDPAPNAGTLMGGPFEFCIEGTPDMVSGISTDPNAVGTNRTFVITDASGVILGLPPTLDALEGVNFEDAGAGVCLIWYLRYEDGLTGAEPGQNTSDLQGSFSLSNSITVTRTEVNAGMISGGPFDFVIDGTPDMVSGITLDGTAVGANSTWVITDDAGIILGLPPTMDALEGVDFDGAGVGTCLIWYLRFEDGLQGAAMGDDAANLDGCFELSNPITVTRT